MFKITISQFRAPLSTATDDDASEVFVQIVDNLDIKAVFNAINSAPPLPKPKKARSDKGVPRSRPLVTAGLEGK